MGAYTPEGSASTVLASAISATERRSNVFTVHLALLSRNNSVAENARPHPQPDPIVVELSIWAPFPIPSGDECE